MSYSSVKNAAEVLEQFPHSFPSHIQHFTFWYDIVKNAIMKVLLPNLKYEILLKLY